MKKAKLIRAKRKRNFSQLCDQDYLSKLPKEDLAWIRKFNNEYYRGSNLRAEDSIHQTPEHVKSVETAVRTAKREVYLSLGKHDVATNTLVRGNSTVREEPTTASFEDNLTISVEDLITPDPTNLLIAHYDLKKEQAKKELKKVRKTKK